MGALWLHLPALQIVIPLLGGILAALLRRGVLAFGLTLAVSWLMPLISALMLHQVLDAGPISYALGGWPPPWGIEYRVDVLNAFVLVLISTIGAIIVPFARRSVAFEVGERREAWFTTPVGCYPDGTSAYGVYDMVGNVWEWTAGEYASYPDAATPFYEPGSYTLRGSSCVSLPSNTRCTYRSRLPAWHWRYHLGFRVVLARPLETRD